MSAPARMFQHDAEGFLVGGTPIEIPRDDMAAADPALDALREIGDSLESIDDRLSRIAGLLGQSTAGVAVAPAAIRAAVLPEGVAARAEDLRSVSSGESSAPGVALTMPKPNDADTSRSPPPRIVGASAGQAAQPLAGAQRDAAGRQVVRVSAPDVHVTVHAARGADGAAGANGRAMPARDERGRFVSGRAAATVTEDRIAQPAVASGQVRPISPAVLRAGAGQPTTPGAQVDRRQTPETVLRQMFGLVGQVPPDSMIREVGGGSAAVPKPGRGVVHADLKRLPRQMRGATATPEPIGRAARAAAAGAAGAAGSAGGAGASGAHGAGGRAGGGGAAGGDAAAVSSSSAAPAAGSAAGSLGAPPEAAASSSSAAPPMPSITEAQSVPAAIPAGYSTRRGAQAPKARDGSGRFLSGKGDAGSSADGGAVGPVGDPSRRAIRGHDDDGGTSAIKAGMGALAEGIKGTLREATVGNSERDPALKAVAEVGRLAGPLASAGRTIFGRSQQAKTEKAGRRSERWLARIWRSVSTAGVAGSGAAAGAPAGVPSAAGAAGASDGAGASTSIAAREVDRSSTSSASSAAGMDAAREVDPGHGQASTSIKPAPASGGAIAGPHPAGSLPAHTAQQAIDASAAPVQPVSGAGPAASERAAAAHAVAQSVAPAPATPDAPVRHASQHDRTAQALDEMRSERTTIQRDSSRQTERSTSTQSDAARSTASTSEASDRLALSEIERQRHEVATRSAVSSSSDSLSTRQTAVAPTGRGMFEVPAGATGRSMPNPSSGPAAAASRVVPVAASRGSAGVMGAAGASAAAAGLPVKVLRTLMQIRSDSAKSDRAQLRVLKEIERKPVAVAGSGGGLGGIMRMLPMLAGALSGALAMLAKLIPGMSLPDGPSLPGAGQKPGGPKAGGGIGGKMKGLAAGALKKLPVIGALAGLAGLLEAVLGGDDADKPPGMTDQDKAKLRAEQVGGAAGGLAGGVAGASSGAAIGSLAGPAGAVVGGVVGGVAGAFGGEQLGQKAGELAHEVATSPAVQEAAAKARAAVAVGASHVADFASKAPTPIKDAAGSIASGAAGMVPAPVANAVRGARNSARDLAREGRWERQKADMVAAAQKAGVDPAVMAKIANFESGFNTDAAPISRDAAKNKVRLFDGRMGVSSAHGLGQFTDATWQGTINKYGGSYGIDGAGSRGGQAGKLTKEQAQKYRADPKIQAAMLAEFTRDNIEMGRKMGGTNDDANVYALHNLGIGDGKRVLDAVKTNPSMNVRDALIGGRSVDAREMARIDSVINGNTSLYKANGGGVVSAGEAYARMGKVMSDGQRFADDATRLAGGVVTPAARQVASLPSPAVLPPTARAMPDRQPGKSGGIRSPDGSQVDHPTDSGVAPPTQHRSSRESTAGRPVAGADQRPPVGSAASLPVDPGKAITASLLAGPAQAVSSAETMMRTMLSPVSARQIGGLSAPASSSSIPTPSAGSIPDVPNITIPSPTLNSHNSGAPVKVISHQQVTQDVSDRSIAHIATGGLGKV